VPLNVASVVGSYFGTVIFAPDFCPAAAGTITRTRIKTATLRMIPSLFVIESYLLRVAFVFKAVLVSSTMAPPSLIGCDAGHKWL